jgi:hypothetical protein
MLGALAALVVQTALALPIDGDGSGGLPDDGPPIDPTCARHSTGTLTATPGSIKLGESVIVSWSVSIPAKCKNPGPLTLNGTPVATQGSITVQPMSNAAYVLLLNGVRLGLAQIAVQLPSTVRIKGGTPAWRDLLIQAVGTPNTLVLLGATVEMDMTGYEGIYIVQGVTLTSEAPPVGNAPPNAASASGTPSVATTNVLSTPAQRAAVGVLQSAATPNTTAIASAQALSANTAAIGIGGLSGYTVARTPRTLGPRLFTNSRPRPLFNIRCNGENIFGNNVRVIGFRLQGPHWDSEDGDENLEQGINVSSCVGVEIANMEISGWSGQGIYIEDPLSLQFNPDAVKIHDNFIHHNQHIGENGYGVDVSAGAYALIERNVFDFNRHAIAASGHAGGYSAQQNLVLKGGGVHGKWYSEHTHLFDVHGTKNCPDTPLTQHIWNCGDAGDQIWIQGNAFQYTEDNAIKLRGAPRVSAYIDHNVFAHDDLDDAIALNDSTRVTVGPNRPGYDSYARYGVCDFDGDGKDDLFLATGVSWWYSSGGKMPWTYLKAATETLDQVLLGDFDGDGRCDVFAVNRYARTWEISSGGSGAWQALPGTYDIPIEELRAGDFNGDRITDIFRRAPDGQWWAISPGHYGWTALQSSSYPLSELRLGDFNGDGITDVLSTAGNVWSVSWGGRSPWQKLNDKLSDDLGALLIGNVDGIPGDDIVRYVADSPVKGHWEMSSGGHGPWQTLGTLTYPDDLQLLQVYPAWYMHSYIGRFDEWNGADVLALEWTRYSKLFSWGHNNFGQWGFWAH